MSPYEIVAPLGAGGMGEVFRARDAKLGRDVAVKVLPAALAADKERVARFRREAQLLAALHHPNVASIFGLEESDGTVALVMELVEGEDLAQRLARGAIPVDEAVTIARQIAEGLEAAHEKGIVHRDLKPANVKLAPDGAVKILDFGLGKALEGEAVAGDVTNSPTMTRHATEAGMILGTAAYMSPEQARGKPADKRADVWAFGVVLFEMLTGKRLFEGETVSDTLAGVLKGEIDFASLPAATPAALRRLLRRCLERNAKNRLHDIADARLELAELEAGRAEDPPARAAAPAARAGRAARLAPWGVALAFALLALGLAVGRRGPVSAPAPVVRATLALPPGVSIELDGARAGTPALSPDGRRIAFGAREGAGPLRIWVLDLTSGAARALPGTEGGYRPFWSPDARQVGFFTWSHLSTTPAEGGPVTHLAPAHNARGGTWSPNGTIVYAPFFTGPLYAVSEHGGANRPLSGSEEKIGVGTHRFPQFLPDGERFLYLDRPTSFGTSEGGIALGSLSGAPVRRLLPVVSNAVFADGYLLTVRDGALVAQPFDARRGAVSGEPRTLAAELLANRRFAFGNFTASAGGLLAYLAGTQRDLSRLVWRDRAGRRLGELGTPGNLSGDGGTDISLDGRWATVSRVDESRSDNDIWIYDLARGTETRLARNETDEYAPVFTHDGTALLYASSGNNGSSTAIRRDLATGRETTLFTATGDLSPMAVSPDGTELVYVLRARGRPADVYARALDGRGEGRVLVKTEGDDSFAQISPDGRWLAWASDESGRYEVYAAPFPAGGARVQVSREGGTQPRWNPKGGELFFEASDNVLTVVPVDAVSGTLSVGTPTRLFAIVEYDGWTYAVAPDGARLLVREPVAETAASSITVLTGWTSLLKEAR